MRKTIPLLLLASTALCLGHDHKHSSPTTSPASTPATTATAIKAAPAYISESPLPVGWPLPGPYNVVTLKKIPAYRAAYTEGNFQNFAFLRLFRHIKRQNIPMTSPVQMEMDTEAGDPTSQKLKMETMAFLYRQPSVGKTGADGSKIEVKDIPARTVLSYTWQGEDTTAARENARTLLDAALKARKITATHYHLLGYNGPSVAKDKKTWELHATVK